MSEHSKWDEIAELECSHEPDPARRRQLWAELNAAEPGGCIECADEAVTP